ncbi:MAG TPA: protein kinase [Blastocatellia bacterium]|nr:protein kinase [Blastocatellia bacterium]
MDADSSGLKDRPDPPSYLRHEVHTPLNAIIGYSEMLLEDADDAGLGAFTSRLQKIHATGKHLLALARDVLDPAKLTAGQQGDNLMALANEIRDRLAIPLSVVIDSSEWLARDVAAGGGAEAAADLQKIHAAGKRLHQFLQEIARPGAQFSNAASVDSAPPAAAQTTRANARAASGAADVPGHLLVVDDNEMNRDILSRILLRRGHRVAMAANGREALGLLEAQSFDLVLLDILMPELDGYETLARMKSSPALSQLPVIFISAFDDVPEKIKAFQAGGVDYITKPFQAEEVLVRAETQLQIMRLQRALREQNQELLRKNSELVEAQQRTDKVFSALADALPGQVLDQKYRLDEKIGSGGFGAVFRATHLGLNRAVAVKVFRPMPGNDSPEALARFRLEGISASRVSHPNAVAVLDCGISESGIAYLVMELLDGHSLASELQAQKALPLARVIEVVVPVCQVLAAVHEQGMVHRDIKPDNIFLHRTPEGEIVKVVDFGLAKIFGDEAHDAAKTVTGGIIGTPAYLAPERITGEGYDGRADVYSLGVIMFQMLTGHLPFEPKDGGAMALLMMHMTKEPPRPRDLNSAVPPDIDALVLATLIKDPAERPGSQQLAQWLTAWQPPPAAGA